MGLPCLVLVLDCGWALFGMNGITIATPRKRSSCRPRVEDREHPLPDPPYSTYAETRTERYGVVEAIGTDAPEGEGADTKPSLEGPVMEGEPGMLRKASNDEQSCAWKPPSVPSYVWSSS